MIEEKQKLIITEKAHPVIKEGQQLQQGFVDQLFDNTTQEDKKNFYPCNEKYG